MSAKGSAIFGTSVGPCGIAWGPRGILGLQLPERSAAATRARLSRRFPEAEECPAPPEAQTAIESIVALLAGEAVDLGFVALDLDGVPDFDRRVYEAAREIPAGRASTYGDIAKRIGEPGAAREVGRAVGANPFPIVVPCHRVLGADGKVGGFSARGGVETKLRILTIERARRQDAPTLFEDLPLAVKPRR